MPAIIRKSLLISILAFVSANSSAGFMEQFFDKEDGQIDASQFVLDNSHGFLPVPFVITEPAVGVGAGAALIFFHETDEQKANRKQNPEASTDIPLSVTGVVGGATSNGTYLTGLFHSGNWQQDRVRYLAGLFGVSINISYYDAGDPEPYDFNMKGVFLLQDIDFRLGDSNFFLGGTYSYMDSDINFDTTGFVPGIDTLSLDSKDGKASVKFTYDNRNNQMSPLTGTKAGIEYSVHDTALGGDFNYQETQVFVHNYNQLSEKWGINLRGDVQTITEDAPFYARPFLNMRGMPAMRYQGDTTALGEVELGYNINTRWTALGFAGAGKAIQREDSFADSEWYDMQGAGFRYLIARQLGMRTGVDVAKGPEDWTIYIQFGTAW